MRLLNVHTFEFEEYVGEVGNGIPPYAILSHTWGPEEVTFKDHVGRGQDSIEKKGYDKIRGCCRLAESEGFQYAWIDTCCIDKSSSAELSEAINSMFRWYRDAALCYAYLSDVDGSEDPAKLSDGEDQSEGSSSFARSRWFKRGWTLQELLAPSEVIFLAADWSEIGTKKSLRSAVSRVTRINEEVLQECRWDKYSVAQKMSWAAGRQTTRLEDAAYCLMGLFDVNMPLLYGEGRKAFSRLQQEIMQRTEDQSIFAWSYPDDEHSHTLVSGMMAPSPEYFKNASQIEVMDRSNDYQGPFEVVNQLVRMRLRLLGDIQGMKLQTYASEPLLYNVLEVQQVDNGPQALVQEEETQVSPNVPAEIQGAGEIPSLAGVAFEDDQIIKIDVDGASPPRSVAREIEQTPQIVLNGEEIEEPEDIKLVPKGHPVWRWYIYEKVIIAPLRCQIGRGQLGILLSRGPAHSSGGKVNLRLHHPSLVIIDSIKAELEAAAVQTMYVTASKVRESINEPLRDGSFTDISWPEIRYHAMKVAGYRAVREAGPAWIVDSEQSLIKSLHPQVVGHEETDYRHAPVVLFYHQSGKDSTYPTLFLRLRVISRYPDVSRKMETLITCDLGIYNPASARSTASMIEDFRIYSANLLQERGMEVASGHDGHSVAVRLRQGHGAFFVNVSFQKACHGRLQTPQDISDASEVKWLKTQLFPKLKSARASFTVG